MVGHLVVWCQVNDCELAEVSDADLAKVSAHLTPDVREVLTVPGALAARSGFGGTAPARVAEQLAALRPGSSEDAAWAARAEPEPGPRRRRWPQAAADSAISGRPRPGQRLRSVADVLASSGAVHAGVLRQARPGGGARPARLRALARERRRAGRRADRRGRGLRGGVRSGLARVPRPDGPQRGDVRAARSCLRLLHLRHALLREPRLPAGRGRLRGPAPGRPGDRGRRAGRRPAAGGARVAAPAGPAARLARLAVRRGRRREIDLARGPARLCQALASTGRSTAPTSAIRPRRCRSCWRRLAVLPRCPRPGRIRAARSPPASAGHQLRPPGRGEPGSGHRLAVLDDGGAGRLALPGQRAAARPGETGFRCAGREMGRCTGDRHH